MTRPGAITDRTETSIASTVLCTNTGAFGLPFCSILSRVGNDVGKDLSGHKKGLRFIP